MRIQYNCCSPTYIEFEVHLKTGSFKHSIDFITDTCLDNLIIDHEKLDLNTNQLIYRKTTVLTTSLFTYGSKQLVCSGYFIIIKPHKPLKNYYHLCNEPTDYTNKLRPPNQIKMLKFKDKGDEQKDE